MAKKQKQREPTPDDDTTPVAPPGASFDTEQGRAAHGMRKDLGRDVPPESESEKKGDQEDREEEDAE